MKADCNKSPVDLLKQTFSALSSLPKEAPRSPTASGNNSPSLSKEKAAKEEDEFAKRFNFNVTNKQQIQDLFKKLLKYGDVPLIISHTKLKLRVRWKNQKASCYPILRLSYLTSKINPRK